jgi:hypothetical protein
MRCAGVILLAILLLPTPLAAQAARLLAPGLRAGQHVPLELTLDPSRPHTIVGEHVQSIELPIGVARVVVPLLAWQTPPGPLVLQIDGLDVTLPLDPPRDDETWIALLAPVEDGLVRSLAPAGRAVRVVAIDPALVPMSSLDAFDLVVLDLVARSRLSDDELGTLLASGVTIALRADAVSPDEAFAWTRRGSFHLLTPPRVGIDALLPDEAVYDAVVGDLPRWPPGFRLVLLAAAAGVGIVLFAAALLPGRGALVAFVIIAVVITAGVATWRATASPAAWTVGLIDVAVDDTSGRVDLWTILASADETTTTQRVGTSGGVVPFSRTHLRTLSPVLQCDERGRPVAIRLTLPRQRPVALLARAWRRGTFDEPATPASPPPWLLALARRLYAGADWRIEPTPAGTVRVTRATEE